VGQEAISGLGNERNNVLIGNAASNVLDGGRGGTDRLTGLAGADIFRFSTRPLKYSDFHADRITDFSSAEGDKIQLSRAAFRLSSSAVVSLATVFGDDSDDKTEQALSTGVMFVYDATQGELHWNQNGAIRGAGSGGILAVLETKPALSAADIVLA
jgi:Ca2+-binding RTX toxin-like protein